MEAIVDTAMRLVAVVILGTLLSGCGSAAPEECPSLHRVDLSRVDPNDDSLAFQYPLDIVEKPPQNADFREHSGSPGGMFHAAEDFWRPAGTEVYAMADGEVSFSGTMGGYGWLVIVDHPEMNIYSLYGHLSPSRWQAVPGPVIKGDIIGYLGDEWENGGSLDEPLVTHLHLGVRVGQRADYPGKGEWRWMAGWIKSCPTELGWLKPSAVIAGQSIPPGGFDGPAGELFERWWTELLLVGAYLLGAVWWIFIGIRKRKPILLLAVGAALCALAWYLTKRGFTLTAPAYLAATLCLITGIVILIRRPHPNRHL
ncbi:MAG: M23 family metallopeptidase [Acidimicrobiia bacterium]|nr:M23 family metallopeptidase [Acidimicrobiia bacterium]